jgi:hypothetical protein
MEYSFRGLRNRFSGFSSPSLGAAGSPDQVAAADDKWAVLAREFLNDPQRTSKQPALVAAAPQGDEPRAGSLASLGAEREHCQAHDGAGMSLYRESPVF